MIGVILNFTPLSPRSWIKSLINFLFIHYLSFLEIQDTIMNCSHVELEPRVSIPGHRDQGDHPLSLLTCDVGLEIALSTLGQKGSILLSTSSLFLSSKSNLN